MFGVQAHWSSLEMWSKIGWQSASFVPDNCRTFWIGPRVLFFVPSRNWTKTITAVWALKGSVRQVIICHQYGFELSRVLPRTDKISSDTLVSNRDVDILSLIINECVMCVQLFYFCNGPSAKDPLQVALPLFLSS
jgi:hypothetical protein